MIMQVGSQLNKSWSYPELAIANYEWNLLGARCGRRKWGVPSVHHEFLLERDERQVMRSGALLQTLVPLVKRLRCIWVRQE